VCQRELEGVVAKASTEAYRPYELERESAVKKRRPQVFV
jgi:hypothetical protein